MLNQFSGTIEKKHVQGKMTESDVQWKERQYSNPIEQNHHALSRHHT